MNAVAEGPEEPTGMTGDPELTRNEPLARHTTWRVGGPADLFFRPRSLDSLRRFLADLPAAMPVTWIGLGSNLLVRDGGIRGAVISTGALPKDFSADGERRARCSAALPCATFARRCARLGLGPAAFFAGIPGSIGGALAMNAGAFGGETWDAVAFVETIDRGGVTRARPKSDFAVAYRSVRGPAGEWFLGASFEFPPADSPAARESEAIRALLRERAAKQPLGLPSAGSVFRNPDGAHAGALIERAGLKGLRKGGAVVADKHANFIINTGTASAADIEALIAEVRQRVHDATGVMLEAEVRILGEALA
jgi:UDP-N-acetylmuramate dehydrogenase